MERSQETSKLTSVFGKHSVETLFLIKVKSKSEIVDELSNIYEQNG